MPLGNCHVENWADSGVADNNSQQTDDTSTDIDIDTDDKHQVGYLSISQTCFTFYRLHYRYKQYNNSIFLNQVEYYVMRD